MSCQAAAPGSRAAQRGVALVTALLVVSLATVAAVAMATLPLSADAQARGFQPEDYYDLVSVSNVAVSPAGFRLAGSFTVKGVGKSRGYPVVTGGRFYLRYDTNLYCYDVTAEGR